MSNPTWRWSARRGVLLLLCLLGAALSGCLPAAVEEPGNPAINQSDPDSQANEPQAGGVLVISANAGMPRHFNTALASGTPTALVGSQIFASPLRYDENWNPQPYLAQSWEVSPDGLTITLNLVHGAVFHDGQPITSGDVAFSIGVVQEYHPFRSMFAPVLRVDTPDDYTALIQLSQPHPAILLAMSPALLPILPEHIYGDGQDLATHPANLAPVGSGPFRLVRYVMNEYVVLERFEDYFIPGRPLLDSILLYNAQPEETQVIDMLRQEAHLMPAASNPLIIDRLRAFDHLVVTTRGNEGLGPLNWLAFNLLRPPLDDLAVRQAIAHAIDRQFIVEYLLNRSAETAWGPIIPQSPFYEANLPSYSYDLQQASQLLDAAGYPIAEDGWRFSLTLDYIPTIPGQHLAVARYIQHQLEKIGIQIELRSSATLAEWGARIADWDFDLTMDLVYNWGDPVIGVHRTYLSDNIRRGVLGSNTQNYRNAEVDDLLAKAQVETSFSRRQALYREFQRIVAGELPVLWLSVGSMSNIYHVGLGNPPLSIWGAHSPLDEVYWIDPPPSAFPRPLPPLALFDSVEVEAVGKAAVELLDRAGLYAANEFFKQADGGFLDLEQSGLHLLGITPGGLVFLDNSQQFKPGMDISELIDRQGQSLLRSFLAAAEGQPQAAELIAAVWPNPITHQTGELRLWCGFLNQGDLVCALRWEDNARSTP